MEYFDNVLQETVEAHKEVTPEEGVYLELEEPESIKKLFEDKEAE